MHGGVAKEELGTENIEALKKGISNLARHVENVKSFGVQPVVAINRFSADTDAELKAVEQACAELGVEAIECTHWADGGAGTEKLARKVVQIAESGKSDFKPLYPDDMPLWDKVRTIAQNLYGAQGIIADKKVRDQFNELQKAGFGHYPVCMAKTQYSFSTDPNLKGAPSNHVVPIREIRISAGAEFLVVVCGEIMTMPGLPRVPAANNIGLNEKGEIDGLF
jgi:formate--tetrahydrofolate ligase